MIFPKLIPTNRERIFLLVGYPLRLSATEAKILHTLQEDGALAQDAFATHTQNALAVRICAINKKAVKISGRRLIIFEDGAYRLNPFL